MSDNSFIYSCPTRMVAKFSLYTVKLCIVIIHRDSIKLPGSALILLDNCIINDAVQIIIYRKCGLLYSIQQASTNMLAISQLVSRILNLAHRKCTKFDMILASDWLASQPLIVPLETTVFLHTCISQYDKSSNLANMKQF